MIKIVVLCDLHVPFEDKTAVEVAFKFCRDMQPEIIVIHEWNDFYELSRFVKNPKKATGYTLHEARETVWKYYGKLRKFCPNSRIIELGANHTKRLQKYLQRNAHELCGLPEFRMENFMEFKKFGIEYMKYFNYKKLFLFKHGDRVHKFSAYTAKNEFESEGMSGASGHTHRLGQFYRTLRGSEYTWMECGCLCNLDQEYMEGRIADWQHGVGLVMFEGKEFRAIPLPIIENKIMWG